jgi:hypothetical protein
LCQEWKKIKVDVVSVPTRKREVAFQGKNYLQRREFKFSLGEKVKSTYKIN